RYYSSASFGCVLYKIVHFLQVLIKSNADPEEVKFVLTSLEIEHIRVMKEETESDSSLRNLVYGLSETLRSATNCLITRELTQCDTS
ncbi:hypothetical protein PENTCL1PPCAC_1541, partial [Pristionchus entomophagus]